MSHARTAIASSLSAAALGFMMLYSVQPAAAHCDPTAAWCPAGNSGTTAGSNFVGTTDDMALELKVNGARGFRLEPNSNSPNVIAGFGGNSVSAGKFGATIGGGGISGAVNSVRDHFGTVGGGNRNAAIAVVSTIGGGDANAASGVGSTIAGGEDNIAGGLMSTVAAGIDNTASGIGSTVAGGSNNTASGFTSFAAGRDAGALADGTFVWADSNDLPFNWNTSNAFAVRSTGGVFFVTAINPSSGAATHSCSIDSNGNLFCSGIIGSSSDRNVKAGFAPVDPADVLRKLAALPIASWSYKGEDKSVRHIGPMAQDFHAAFKVGADDKHIAMVDGDGVALAAIQGLYKILKEKDAQIAAQQRQIDALKNREAQVEALTQRLDALERQVRAEKPEVLAKAR